MTDLVRCDWANGSASMAAYHDSEWGVPQHDDRVLFEFVILEGAQAGLSWQTVLNKRDGYRRAFHGFEIERVAAMTDDELERLMLDPSIIRNRAKIQSARANAQAVLKVQSEFGSLDNYLWDFVGGAPIVGDRRSLSDIPARTPESDKLSKALAGRGFKFVGSTICYAFMQAVGMADDHLATCFRRNAETAQTVQSLDRPEAC